MDRLNIKYAKSIYAKTGGCPGVFRRALLRANNLFTTDVYTKKMLFDFHYYKAINLEYAKDIYGAAYHAKKALKYSKKYTNNMDNKEEDISYIVFGCVEKMAQLYEIIIIKYLQNAKINEKTADEITTLNGVLNMGRIDIDFYVERYIEFRLPKEYREDAINNLIDVKSIYEEYRNMILQYKPEDGEKILATIDVSIIDCDEHIKKIGDKI